MASTRISRVALARAANSRSRSRSLSPPPSPTPTKPKKKRGRVSRKQANQDPSLPQPTTTSGLLSQVQQTTDEWFHSRRTTKGYARNVKAGREWLEGWVELSKSLENDEELEGAGDMINPAFANAFDEIGEHTPTVLTLYTTLKCEQEGCKFATAEAIRSSFKDYFEQVHGRYGDWKYNMHTAKWEGNPVFEQKYRNYYDSLRNRKNRTETAEQSLPMLPVDLKVIMDYLDSPEGISKYSETRRLFFKAYATTAFTLWTRNEEMVTLQRKNVSPYQVSAAGEPYINFRLIFRKTNKDPTNIQQYQVPQDPDMPHIDCYTHMHNWLAHLQKKIPRPLEDDDYIFPGISSTGQLKFGEGPISRTAFETLLENIINDSGVLEGRNGKFTTHCFRRGGCQYRFMWAPVKWSLKAVKWWGGWSSNDNVGTIMRYLLDELMTFEESFGDIMMKTRPPNRHEVLDNRSTNVQDDRLTKAQLEAVITQLFDKLASSPIRVQNTPQERHPASHLYTPASSQRSPPSCPTMPPTPQTPCPEQHMLSLSSVRPTSTVPRIPACGSLDDALTYWDSGCPDAGVMFALHDWESRYPNKRLWPQTEAVKYGNIKSVVDEFRIHCHASYQEFESQYPGLRKRYTKLYQAIRKAKIARGDATSRSPRKK